MKLKYSFEVMELDDCIVAVPVDITCSFQGVIRLNESAAEIFELLKEDTSETDIVRRMASHYDSSEEDLHEYVRYTIQKLSAGGFLTES